MAKRDPNKTARNKAIAKLKTELRNLSTLVFPEIDRKSEASLNAFIGHKTDFFIDLKNEVIRSPEEYVTKWLQGMERCLENGEQGSIMAMHDYLVDKRKVNFRKYCELFLKRSFLKHYDELSKVRPREGEAHFWFGLNNAQHGLFVTPRFQPSKQEWENDKSEVRAFPELYWTIGHVLKTGLCYPNNNRKYEFKDVDAYLNFFYNQVRLTKSTYQLEIAELYIDFVDNSPNPTSVPLLIPEMRFNSHSTKHLHRLDFLIINPFTMEKVGFELSPWSTHGKLSGRKKTLKQLNSEANENFEKEIKKMRAYYSRYSIYTVIYSDSDLNDMAKIFTDMKKYLSPTAPPPQLSFNLIDEYFGSK